MNLYQHFQQATSIRHLNFSPDDKLLLGQTETGDVTVWQLSDGKQVAHLSQLTHVPACLGLDDQGYFIVVARQQEVSIMRLTDNLKNKMRLETGHNVGQLLLRPNGNMLVTVNSPAFPTKAWYKMPLIQFWDLTKGKCVQRIYTRYLTRSGPIFNIEITVPTTWSELAVLINYERNDWARFVLNVYRLKKTGLRRSYKKYKLGEGYMAFVQQLACSDDGQLLTLSVRELAENYIVAYARKTSPAKNRSPFSLFRILDRVQSNKETLLEPTPRALYKKAGMFCFNYELLHEMSIKQFVMTNEHLIVAYDQTGLTTVWQNKTLGSLPAALKHPSSILIYDQEHRLVMGNQQGDFSWYHLPSLKLMSTHQEHQGAICCLLATQNGSLLVSGCTEGRINVWAVE